MSFPLSPHVQAEAIEIAGIPGYRFKAEACQPPYPSLIFYHGWQSNADRQCFRAGVLAAFGYQVFIFDGPMHGKRGQVDDTPENVLRYFWQVIDQEVAEFPIIYEELLQGFSVDPNRLAVMGHSMGAFISLALMTEYPYISCGIGYNGASDWSFIEENLAMNYRTTPEAIKAGRSPLGEVVYRPSQYNPLQAADKLVNRPLFLTNGAEDQTIPLAGNLRLADYLQAHNKDEGLFKHEIYEGIGHIVTDGMMADGLNFLKEHLK